MNNNPLIIHINAGLGNQLFMLFAGISKAIDENRKFLIYPNSDNNRKFYFNNFYSWLSSYVITHVNKYHLRCYIDPSNECYNKIPDNIDFIEWGYFQSEKYFIHNYEILREMFKIDDFQNKYQFKNKNNIAIHLRLGDYCKAGLLVLSSNYYIHALNIIKEKLGDDFYNYNFIVFSEKEDDNIITKQMNEINSNFENKLNMIKIYDCYNDNILNEYEELILMSNCNHFIIANSTYSWWGSYLSKNKNKIVVCPFESCMTLQNKDLIRPDYYPDNYIQIKTV